MWAYYVVQAVQAVFSIAQGVSEAKEAKDNAKTEGKIAMAQAEARAGQVTREGERLQSEQLAAAGGSGVVPVSGSPLELMMETMTETALRREDEIYGGRIQKWGAKRRGNAQANQAYMGIVSGLLKTGSSVAGMYGGSGGGISGVMGSSYSRVNSGSSWGGGASNYSLGVRY